MATLITGRLVTGEPMDFSGYRIAADFEQKIDLGDGTVEFVPARVGAAPAPDGTFQLELPDTENRRGPIAIKVAGPSGLPAGQHEIPEGGPFENLSINVLACAPTLVTEPPDLTLGAQIKYTGRAIHPTGRGLATGLLIVLWARAEGTEVETPVSVTRTVEGGYFSAPWPSARYDAAFAVVSGGDPISVPLENNHLPRRLILVVESIPAPTADQSDCDCRAEPPRAPDQIDLASNPQSFSADPGRCVNFTIPNRTVEEVSYQAVVRTTQPELKGTMLPRAAPIPEAFIGRLMQLAQRSPTEVGVDGASPPVVEVLPPAATPALPGPTTSAEGDRELKFSSAVLASAQSFAPGISLDGGLASTAHAPNELAEKVLQARVQANQPLRLETSVVAELAREPGGITSRRLLEAEQTSIVRNFRNTVALMDTPGTARFNLDDQRQLDWDASPDAYQATTIAHGHLLTLKQVWRADGYSLGDLLYSLPLAPGQQKLISTLDWSRTEVSTRRAQRQVTEELAADLSHDRDVNDIIRSSLSEHLDANSEAHVRAGGFALGGFIGPLIFGGGGGVSSAGSTASQTSARSVTGSALNRIRDRTLQSASAVRSQRTTVVQTARQGESVRAQTEVVANNNHCHAVTVEYFEVLRHFQVTQELAHVQECLFIPFAVSPFNEQKAMRWREILRSRLRRQELSDAFDALERKVTNWQKADFPLGRYADDLITYLDGDFLIRVHLPRPADNADDGYVEANWLPYKGLLTADDPEDIWNRYMGVALPEKRTAIWDTRIAPGVAQRLLEKLTFELIGSGPLPGGVSIDPTLVSRFAQNRPLRVSLRANLPLPAWTRAQIERIRIALNVTTTLPAGAEMLMESASVHYRTDHFAHALFRNHRTLNDLTIGDAVEIATPLNLLEKRNPRQRDQRSAKRLIDHLNEHIEYYHRAIWMDMDPNRRYLLLDGFIAPDAGGRSVASVVENRVIGIVGNCLAMPVAPGQQLDCTYAFADATFEDLRNLYAGDPVPPMRISVPTSGVFAEAVMGECNSCEKIDDMRFWRWEEAPIPDQPTLIAPLSTDTRRTTPPPLTPDQFPEPLVRLQETPAAPAPSGLAAAVNALGVGNIFKDLTGLALNQANAAEALKASIKTAQGFASKASALAQQKFLNRELDRGLENIKAARDQGLITKEQARERTENLLRGAIGEERPQQTSPTKVPAVQKAMERVPTAKRGSLRVTRPEGTVEVTTGRTGGGTTIDVAINPDLAPVRQTSNMTCWAAGGLMMASWRDRTSMVMEDFLDSLGGDWRKKFDKNEGLTANQARAFFATVGLVEEGPASYTPEGLARLLADHGPLLEIGDDSIDNNRVVHVRIITAVRGDGTPQGTKVKLADSASGTIVEEPFTSFDQRHSSTDPVRFGVGLFHF